MIHVDPRFSRTSALADLHVSLRAGQRPRLPRRADQLRRQRRALAERPVLPDVPPALHQRRADRRPTTSATPRTWTASSPATIPETRRYDTDILAVRRRSEPRRRRVTRPPQDQQASEGGAAMGTPRQRTRSTRRCKTRAASSRSSSATSRATRRRWSSSACGVPRDLFWTARRGDPEQLGPRADDRLRLRRRLDPAHDRHPDHRLPARCCNCCSATSAGRAAASWRCAATPRIQGSTDIPTLYNLLPGYLPMPTVPDRHATLAGLSWPGEQLPTGSWYNAAEVPDQPAQGLVRRRRHPDNDYAYDLLPKIDDDYSFQPMLLLMRDGLMRGLFCMGRTRPSAARTRFWRAGRWPTSTGWWCATSTRSRPRRSGTTRPRSTTATLRPSDIKTEIFLMPAAIDRREGRLLHQHPAARAVARQGRRSARRLPLGSVVLSIAWACGSSELYADDHSPRGRQLAALTWDYPTLDDRVGDPDLDAVVREINGYTVADGTPGQRLHRAQGRRLDRLRLLDLLRHHARRGPKPRAQPAGRRPSRARLGLRLAAQRPHPLQPRLRRP